MNWIKELLTIDQPEMPKGWQPVFALTAMTVGLLYRFWKHGTMFPLVLLVTFWMFFILRPKWWSLFLRNLLWSILSLLNAAALIALTLAFYLSFTPMGLWKRRKGWNPMRQGFNSELASYREPAEELRARHFEKPF